jgi:hypothetical protein
LNWQEQSVFNLIPGDIIPGTQYPILWFRLGLLGPYFTACHLFYAILKVFVSQWALVLYHGLESWRAGKLSSCFKGLTGELRAFIPDFKYIFVDLSKYSNEEIKDKIFSLASLKISLLMLKNIFNIKEPEKNLGDFFEIGRMYFQEPEGLQFLESIIKYIYQATEIQTESGV